MRVKSINFIISGLLLLSFSTILMAADEEAPEKKSSGYVSLGDSMVLNLSTDSKRLTFLQLKADVLIKDDNTKSVIETHIPAIRHKLIVLLSGQSAIDMKTATKREQIRQQATTEIREMLEKMADNKDIEEVLFTNFLVQ